MKTPRAFSSVRISRIRTPLDAHAGEADDVGPRQRSKSIGSTFSSMSVTVMPGGRQRGEQRQAGDRQVGTLAQQRQRVLQAPVGHLEPRIDEDDVGHGLPASIGPVDPMLRRRGRCLLAASQAKRAVENG